MPHIPAIAVRFRRTASGDEKVYLDYRLEGQRIREVVGPKSPAIVKLAKELVVKRQSEMVAGTFLGKREQERLQFRDFVKTYKEVHASKKKSFGRITACLAHLLDEFGERLLSTIGTFDVERYQTKRAKEAKPATVNRELAILKNLFYKAMAWGKAEKNPVRGVKRLAENNERVRFLSPEEGVALEAACGAELLPIVIVARHTGMRKGELMALRKSDINFKTGFVRVQEAKNGSGREVPLSRTAQNVLEKLSKESKIEFVFDGWRGGRLTSRWLYDAFLAACKKAEIVDFRFHDLRHDCASQLVMRGQSLQTVAKILGHRTLAMTLRYAHLSPGHLQTAVRSLDQNSNVGTGLDNGPSDPAPNPKKESS